MGTVLSILIPTYNRASFLERLLLELESQLSSALAVRDVEIIVGDNASEDSTQMVLKTFSARNPDWTALRHSTNLGADANILSLLSRARGRHIWIIGDDDLPCHGLIQHLFSLLSSRSPSLLYLPSLWSYDVSDINLDPSDGFRYRQVSNLSCARELHIWTTFLSSWIFNADQLFEGLSSNQLISSGQGSFFIQLGWILPLLVFPQSTIYIAKDPGILATSGNTGGYAILRTFIVNYPSLVCKYTGSSTGIRMALIGKALRAYIPSLIVSVRLGKAYHHAGDTAGIFSDSFRYLWYYPSFWLLCLPALLLPVELIQLIRSSVSVVKRVSQKLGKFT